jgi:hypothetical protein
VSTKQKLTGEPVDRKAGMTFGELAAFVDAGRAQGVEDGELPVVLRSSWRGRIRQITVGVEVGVRRGL